MSRRRPNYAPTDRHSLQPVNRHLPPPVHEHLPLPPKTAIAVVHLLRRLRLWGLMLRVIVLGVTVRVGMVRVIVKFMVRV